MIAADDERGGAGVEDPSEQKQIAAIVGKLYEAFVESDALLCEINPLIVTPDGEVKALDSKFTVDDSALYKHPDIAEMRDLDAYPAEERAARENGVTYVKLDGEVGVLGNGAGLVMSTLDVVALAGGRPELLQAALDVLAQAVRVGDAAAQGWGAGP